MNTPAAKATSAYVLQAALSFGIALAVVVIGECYLPVPNWTRAFLAIGTVFLVSSSFTLAKTIRDQQESSSVVNRLDQARLERLLAEFDPYRPPTVADPQPTHEKAPGAGGDQPSYWAAAQHVA